MRRPQRLTLARSVCLTAVLFVLLCLGGNASLRCAGSFLDAGEKLRSADYVLILGGGADTRPFVAAAMVRADLAPVVLVSHWGTAEEASPSEIDGIVPPHSELVRRVLRARGVGDHQILLMPPSRSTLGEAQHLNAFLEGKPDVTVAVVTNDYHTRRARWAFDKILGKRRHQAYIVSAPCDTFSSEDWWKSRFGMKTYLSEFFKLGIYVVALGGMRLWGLIAGSALAVAFVFLRRSAVRTN